MGEPRVGVQLIIYGGRPQADLPGVLAEVAEAGYDGIEGGAPPTDEQYEHVRSALAKTDLAFTGGHCGFGDLRDPAGLRDRIRYVKMLGGGYLIASGGNWETMDAYLDAAKAMNDVGRQCRAEGLSFCYHNHHWEFRKFDGTTALHAMIGATDPDLVKLCPDVYWVHVGGEQPADFISRYRDRCPYLHFKDGLAGDQYTKFRELGRGKVDLPAALKAAMACEPDWIVVEQDSTELTPAESNRISRDYLKTLGL